MCGIYKIQNNINGKIYIGKSINIKHRWSEHKRDSLVDDEKWENNYRGVQTPIHKAIRKYGVENFTFEVVEICEKEQLNEREIYWIKQLNLTNKNIGYNVTLGGDGYRCGGGENAPGCKITKVESEIIKQKLKERWTVKEIQKLVPLATSGMVHSINYGLSWFDENEIYPISRDNGHRLWSDEEALTIKQEYANGESMTALARKYNCSLDTISSLIRGKSYTNLPIIEKQVDWCFKNPMRKFSEEQVKEFRRRAANGESIKSLRESCGIKCNYATFYNMIKKITYKDIP